MPAPPWRPRSIALSLALAAACFDDPPSIADSTDTGTGDSSSSMATETSTTDSSATTPSTTGPGDDDGVVDTSTSSVGSDDSADTTTASEPLPPGCGCPRGHVFCDGFESWPGLWGLPEGGGGTEEQDLEIAYCDAAAARTEVTSGDQFAVLVGETSTTTGAWVTAPGSVHTVIRVSPGCTGEAGFVRILDFQLRTAPGGLWYGWSIAVAGGQLRLSAVNHAAMTVSWTTGGLPDAWAELRLDLDFAGATPNAALFVDGVVAIDATPGAPELANEAAMEQEGAPHVVLGSYFYDMPFTGDCTVWYDDIWAAPM